VWPRAHPRVAVYLPRKVLGLAALTPHILCVLHDALFRTTLADRYASLLARSGYTLPVKASGGMAVTHSGGRVVKDYLVIPIHESVHFLSPFYAFSLHGGSDILTVYSPMCPNSLYVVYVTFMCPICLSNRHAECYISVT
jgi:hypothetical protein